MKSLLQWTKTHSSLLMNAGSLVGTTAVTSILGFIYWWLAARQFSVLAVGLASSSISAMFLIGDLCTLGLGTMLVGELANLHGKKSSLISASMILTLVLGGVVGITYAAITPYIFSSSKVLGTSIPTFIIFGCGVGLTSLTLAFDQALIGLLRGDLQLYRNIVFAAVKLVVLFLVSLWISNTTGLSIYITWAVGNIVSLMLIALLIQLSKGRSVKYLVPDWVLLRKLGLVALKHHSLNLTLNAPSLLLPILVTVVLSAKENAWFYVAWSLGAVANSVSSALSVTLYAVGTAQPSALAQKMRVTLGLAAIACLFANLVLFFGAKQVLGIFGSSYAQHAAWCLRVLSLESFPFLLKNHFTILSRIHGRIGRTTLITIVTGIFELVLSVMGAHLWGINGVSIGWTTAISIEALFMFPTVLNAVRFSKVSSETFVGDNVFDDDTSQNVIALIETSPMPTIRIVSIGAYSGNENSFKERIASGKLPGPRMLDYFGIANEETIKLPNVSQGNGETVPSLLEEETIKLPQLSQVNGFREDASYLNEATVKLPRRVLSKK